MSFHTLPGVPRCVFGMAGPLKEKGGNPWARHGLEFELSCFPIQAAPGLCQQGGITGDTTQERYKRAETEGIFPGLPLVENSPSPETAQEQLRTAQHNPEQLRTQPRIAQEQSRTEPSTAQEQPSTAQHSPESAL